MSETHTLTFEQTSLMKLIARSADVGDGWRRVSATLWSAVTAAGLPAEIAEIEEEKSGGRIRLTDTGRTLLAYKFEGSA